MPKSMAEAKISAAATQRPSIDNDRQVELQVISCGRLLLQGKPWAKACLLKGLGQMISAKQQKTDKKLKKVMGI